LEVALAVLNPVRVELLAVDADLLGEDTRPIFATLTPPVVVIGFLTFVLTLLGDKL
jgi:hypothetical protein